MVEICGVGVLFTCDVPAELLAAALIVMLCIVAYALVTGLLASAAGYALSLTQHAVSSFSRHCQVTACCTKGYWYYGTWVVVLCCTS